MARSEARLSVDIWNDVDFRALSRDAQWAFMFLLSQHDLAHDGVLALRVRRWSQCAVGMTAADMGRFLDELERARFIVVDYDAEELLIRSFIRRDKVFKQPNVLRAAADHLPLVSSQPIRRALAVELERVSLEPMTEQSATILKEMREALPNPFGNPEPNPPGNPSADPKPDPSAGTPGERGVVTAVVTDFPVPRSSKSPDPPTLATLGADFPNAGKGSRKPPAALALIDIPSTDLAIPPNAGALNAEWIDHCRRNGIKLTRSLITRYGKGIKLALEQGFDPNLIKRALALMLEDGEASRPSYLEYFLVRVQQGPARRPRRLTAGEESARTLAANNPNVVELVNRFFEPGQEVS